MTAARIGFIGLGVMGQGMAGVLLRAGHTVRVYNRTRERADALATEGAEVTDTPAEAAAGCDFAVTMVADDTALEEVTTGPDGLLGRLAEGGVHLSMSTVSPALATRLADAHAGAGERLVSAPVFGRPQVAAAGNLWICCSGDEAARQRARPLLDQMGQGVFDFGDDPAAAAVVKLAGNFAIIAATEAMGEAYTLAERSGVAREAVHQFLTSTLFGVPIYQNYGSMIAEDRFSPPGFRLRLGYKDIGLLLQTARAAGVPLPLGSLLHDRLLSSIAKGRGDLDVAALAMESRDSAGL